MAQPTTQLWENTSDQDIEIVHLGLVFPAHGRVSFTGEYHPQIIPANYPGLVNITDVADLPAPENGDPIAEALEAQVDAEEQVNE